MQHVTSLFICPGQTQSSEDRQRISGVSEIRSSDYFLNYGLYLQPMGLEQVRNCKKAVADTLRLNTQTLLVAVGPTRELSDTYNVLFDPLFPVCARHEFREKENLRTWNWASSAGHVRVQPASSVFIDAPTPNESEEQAIERIIATKEEMERDAEAIGASAILYIVSRSTMRIIANQTTGNPIERISLIPQPDYAELWISDDRVLRPVRFGCGINQIVPLVKKDFTISGHKGALTSNPQLSMGHNNLGLEVPVIRPRQEELP